MSYPSHTSRAHTSYSNSSFLLEGDREKDLALQQRQHDAAAEILAAIGGLLQGADSSLSNLEQNIDLLPSAILRKCQELADGIGDLATRLEEHSPEEQRLLAQACAQDFQQLHQENSLQLQLHDDDNDNDDDTNVTYEPKTNDRTNGPWTSTSTSTSTLATIPTEDQFLRAIQGASTLLRDVEAAFREISEEDAEDIADATLTLARLFLLSLQNVLQTLSPQDLLLAMETSSSTNENNNNSSRTFRSFNDNLNIDERNVVTLVIEELDENGEINKTSSSVNDTSDDDVDSPAARGGGKSPARRRVRVLWPRIGPHVADALNWGKEAATHRPFLAVALGLTLWPAAILTTCVGGSLVLVDHAIQDMYQHFQDGPLVSNLEQGAAQLLQAAKLSLVVSSVVGKQTWRVVQRQVKRHGGVEKIAHSVTEAALERVKHPIETIGMAWNGLSWSISTVTDTVQQILQQREELHVSQGLQ